MASRHSRVDGLRSDVLCVCVVVDLLLRLLIAPRPDLALDPSLDSPGGLIHSCSCVNYPVFTGFDSSSFLLLFLFLLSS